jgi:hypothetical protein
MFRGGRLRGGTHHLSDKMDGPKNISTSAGIGLPRPLLAHDHTSVAISSNSNLGLRGKSFAGSP